MTKRLYRDGQYLGGSRPAKRCSRGHKLSEPNLVKAGQANNPRCKICRARINADSRARLKAKAEERA